MHGFDRAGCFRLDGSHHHRDFLGGLAGTLGKFAHFVGDYGETTALGSSAGCLDGGIEGKEIGLIGNVVDDGDDATDLFRILAKLGDASGGALGGFGDAAHGGERLIDNLAALAGGLSSFL